MENLKKLAHEGYFSIPELNQLCQMMDGKQLVSDEVIKTHYAFLHRPDVWRYTPDILQHQGCCDHCKITMCKALELFVDNNWRSIEPEVRTPIFDLLLSMAFQGTNSGLNEQVLTFLNGCLIHILVLELPENRPQFISQLIESSNTQNSSKNCLSLLSEFCRYIFDDNGESQLPSHELSRLEGYIGENSQAIFTYLLPYLSSVPAEDDVATTQVVRNTLDLLHFIIRFVPPNVIHETGLFQNIISNFFTKPTFLSSTIFVITDIFLDPKISGSALESTIPGLFKTVVSFLGPQIPTNPNGFDAALYQSGPLAKRNLDRALCYFLTVFMDRWGRCIEIESLAQEVNTGRDWMMCLTRSTDENLMQTVAEFWLNTMRRIFQSGNNSLVFHMYEPIFPQLRRLLARNMTHPREILLEYNPTTEELTINREDNLNTVLFELMIESFKFLVKIGTMDSMAAIHELFQESISEKNMSLYNSACYSMTALKGIVPPNQGSEFVTAILTLQIDLARSNDVSPVQKALFVSGLMYVASKFTKYFMKQTPFLFMLIDKLFDFMSIDIHGIPEMAVNAFKEITEPLHIVKLFTEYHPDKKTSYIAELIKKIPRITELPYFQNTPTVMANFYEILARILANSPKQVDTNIGVAELLKPLNAKWDKIIHNLDGSLEASRAIESVVQANIGIAKAIKRLYDNQMKYLFPNILEIYKMFSANLIPLIESRNLDYYPKIQSYKNVKSGFLDLISAYFSGLAQDHAVEIGGNYIQGIISLFTEYEQSPNQAKVASLISLTQVVFQQLGQAPYLAKDVPRIYFLVFRSTRVLIADNFTDNPDFRLPFFQFLLSMVQNYSTLLFTAPPEEFNSLVTIIMHGINHYQHEICEAAIQTTAELVKGLKVVPDKWAMFLGEYSDKFIIVVFDALQDTAHKFAFDVLVDLLSVFFLEIPEAIRVKVKDILVQKFQGIDPALIMEKLVTMMGVANNKIEFRKSIRDFIIMSKHFKQYEPAFEKFENKAKNLVFEQYIAPIDIDEKDFLE